LKSVSRGDLLHQKLERVVRRPVGTDIDSEGIRFMLSKGM